MTDTKLTPEQRSGLRKFADMYARYIGTPDEQEEFNQLADYVDACTETITKRRAKEAEALAAVPSGCPEFHSNAEYRAWVLTQRGQPAATAKDLRGFWELACRWRRATEGDAAVAVANEIESWIAERLSRARTASMEEAARIACPRPLVMGEHACKDRTQCWERCGDLGNHEEYTLAQQYVRGLTIHMNRYPNYWLPLMEQCYVVGYKEALKVSNTQPALPSTHPKEPT